MTWGLSACSYMLASSNRRDTKVMLLELDDCSVERGHLIGEHHSASDPARNALMATLDRINAKWGKGTLGIGSAGMQQSRRWAIKCGHHDAGTRDAAIW